LAYRRREGMGIGLIGAPAFVSAINELGFPPLFRPLLNFTAWLCFEFPSRSVPTAYLYFSLLVNYYLVSDS